MSVPLSVIVEAMKQYCCQNSRRRYFLDIGLHTGTHKYDTVIWSFDLHHVTVDTVVRIFGSHTESLPTRNLLCSY
jgi:hypothetical protein